MESPTDMLAETTGDICSPAWDQRRPWVTVEIPEMNFHLFGRTNLIGGRYGVLLPKVQFWNDITTVFILDLVLGAVLATVVFHFILQRRGTPTAFLVGFGAVIPFCILFPYSYVAFTGVQNMSVRFTLCLPLVLYAFKCLEAMFGFTPFGAKASLRSFCMYYAAPAELISDRKTGRVLSATKEDIIRNSFSSAWTMIFITILLSVFSPFGYEPFYSNAREFDEGISVSAILHPGHLGNCFLAAMLFQLCLALSGAGFGVAVQLATGHKVIETMRNPMLEATSSSDFWGRRWNVLIHGILKRGVYKPVRKYSSGAIALLAAFLASSLFHEWLIHVVVMFHRTGSAKMIIDNSCPRPAYSPRIGSNSAFFMWNGLVMLIEKLIGRSVHVQAVGRALPRPVVTLLIIMTALPVAHWFANPYIKSGFFFDYQAGFPMIVKVA